MKKIKVEHNWEKVKVGSRYIKICKTCLEIGTGKYIDHITGMDLMLIHPDFSIKKDKLL